MRLIDADALLESVKVIGNRPLPDVRTVKDLEQAIVNTYHAILNEITNAPTVNQYEREIAVLKADNKIYAECNETIKAELATELKRVSSYKTLVNSLEGQVSHYSQKDYSLSAARLHGLEQSLISEQEMNETLTNENFELQASNHTLRAALARTRNMIRDNPNAAYTCADEALSASPAESLQAFENDVIEKCAKVCDGYSHGTWFADAIRALKGKV